MGNKDEKKRRIVNAIAAAAAFFAVFALSRLLSAAAYALLVTDGSHLPAGVNAAIWAVSLGAGCALALAVVRPRREAENVIPEEVRKPLRAGAVYLVPAALFLLLAVNITISLTGLGSAEVPSYSTREFIIRAILGCTVYPILEETFFRGVLLGALRERDDPFLLRLAAVAATTAAFAAVHPDGGFVFTFIAGVILAAIAPYGTSEGRRSVIPVGAIAAHALYNLSLYVSLALTKAGAEPIVPLSAIAGIAAVTAGIMLLTGGKSRWKEKK